MVDSISKNPLIVRHAFSSSGASNPKESFVAPMALIDTTQPKQELTDAEKKEQAQAFINASLNRLFDPDATSNDTKNTASIAKMFQSSQQSVWVEAQLSSQNKIWSLNNLAEFGSNAWADGDLKLIYYIFSSKITTNDILEKRDLSKAIVTQIQSEMNALTEIRTSLAHMDANKLSQDFDPAARQELLDSLTEKSQSLYQRLMDAFSYTPMNQDWGDLNWIYVQDKSIFTDAFKEAVKAELEPILSDLDKRLEANYNHTIETIKEMTTSDLIDSQLEIYATSLIRNLEIELDQATLDEFLFENIKTDKATPSQEQDQAFINFSLEIVNLLQTISPTSSAFINHLTGFLSTKGGQKIFAFLDKNYPEIYISITNFLMTYWKSENLSSEEMWNSVRSILLLGASNQSANAMISLSVDFTEVIPLGGQILLKVLESRDVDFFFQKIGQENTSLAQTQFSEILNDLIQAELSDGKLKQQEEELLKLQKNETNVTSEQKQQQQKSIDEVTERRHTFLSLKTNIEKILENKDIFFIFNTFGLSANESWDYFVQSLNKSETIAKTGSSNFSSNPSNLDSMFQLWDKLSAKDDKTKTSIQFEALLSLKKLTSEQSNPSMAAYQQMMESLGLEGVMDQNQKTASVVYQFFSNMFRRKSESLKQVLQTYVDEMTSGLSTLEQSKWVVDMWVSLLSEFSISEAFKDFAKKSDYKKELDALLDGLYQAMQILQENNAHPDYLIKLFSLPLAGEALYGYFSGKNQSEFQALLSNLSYQDFAKIYDSRGVSDFFKYIQYEQDPKVKKELKEFFEQTILIAFYTAKTNNPEEASEILKRFLQGDGLGDLFMNIIQDHPDTSIYGDLNIDGAGEDEQYKSILKYTLDPDSDTGSEYIPHTTNAIPNAVEKMLPWLVDSEKPISGQKAIKLLTMLVAKENMPNVLASIALQNPEFMFGNAITQFDATLMGPGLSADALENYANIMQLGSSSDSLLSDEDKKLQKNFAESMILALIQYDDQLIADMFKDIKARLSGLDFEESERIKRLSWIASCFMSLNHKPYEIMGQEGQQKKLQPTIFGRFMFESGILFKGLDTTFKDKLQLVVHKMSQYLKSGTKAEDVWSVQFDRISQDLFLIQTYFVNPMLKQTPESHWTQEMIDFWINLKDWADKKIDACLEKGKEIKKSMMENTLDPEKIMQLNEAYQRLAEEKEKLENIKTMAQSLQEAPELKEEHFSTNQVNALI